MNNFFYKEADFSLFRKALKQTEDEPVIINILSTDSSLKENAKHEEAPVARKNLSNKFQPNPFSKFFGPRKQRTTPVDMGSFSSWKNKNYREAEQKLSTASEDATPSSFSLADYMNKNTADKKFNEMDQAKSELQKPITQLSSDDPTYKKYSLDSYLHKLEQQSQVKNEFEENSDILEPLVDMNMQEVVPTSGQDEVFGNESAVNVEDFSFNDDLAGEHFSFEKEELDKVRSRLDKLEREANNIKEKQTEKVISTNELSNLAKDEEDDFDLEKLGIEDDELLDDIEKVNDKFGAENIQEKPDAPKVQGKRFIEINRTASTRPNISKSAVEENSTDATADASMVESTEGVVGEAAEVSGDATQVSGGRVATETASAQTAGVGVVGRTVSGENNVGEGQVVEGQEDIVDKSEFVTDKTVSRDDVLTKEDFRTMTDEFMTKFTELYQKNERSPQQTQIPAGEGVAEGVADVGGDDLIGYVNEQEMPIYGDPYSAYQQEQTPVGYTGYGPMEANQNQLLQQQQTELQTKIIEMLENNKKSDVDAEEKLRLAKLENQRMSQEYETRLKELEASFKKRDEEMKKQAYLDKLKSDIKLKKAETSYKKKEEEFKEFANASSEKVKFGIMLKKELENNLNVSNLEMDKKLLEVASKNKKKVDEEVKVIKEQIQDEVEEVEEIVDEVEEEETEKPKKSTTKKPSTRRRISSKTTRSRTRSPRRKIDSDIIGGIDFE